MRKFISFILVVIFATMLTACGGGGGGDTTNNTTPPVTTPVVAAPDIQGNYTLTATTIKYADGVTITEKDINITGTMIIQPEDIVQTMTIESTTFSSDVNYSTVWNADFSGGTIHTATKEGEIRDLTFTYDQTNKSLSIYSGVVNNDGVSYEEWDTWTPTPTTTTVNKSQSSNTNKIQDGFVFIADHLKNGGK